MEFASLRFAEKILVFAFASLSLRFRFASLFDSKKNSLSQSIFGQNLPPWWYAVTWDQSFKFAGQLSSDFSKALLCSTVSEGHSAQLSFFRSRLSKNS
jgi:hypothetical protein